MRRVLLDANLVVLLVVGNVSRERIEHHKRLAAYVAEDWDLLIAELSRYDQIVVTPNILTEASNLVRSGDKAYQADFAHVFAELSVTIVEHYVPSETAVFNVDFDRLGLADAASIEVGTKDLTLLTADVGLYLAALRHGHEARNFNHLREGA